ncbi:disease resistance-like protein DSC1 [Mangifera indica]|uniref:disease resistance-like protein DSC1 n=1 Tax=Mangifera indica TaxID=29780 RepID=UPI001CFBCA55|nr:disease resistance-like protein DSC1 [Mangifera indica]
MANLSVLIVNISDWSCNNKVYGYDNIEFDFSKLICLCWDHYPFPSLPKKFYHENFVVLKICNNSNNFGQVSSVCNLKSLRWLDLSGLSNLKAVPEISCNIEELYLDGTVIKELSSTIENVSNLERLSLRNCSSLESLPNGICKLKFLKYLCISGCLKIDRLPEDIGNLEGLEALEADDLTEVPSSIVRLKNLHGLSLERCKRQGLMRILSPILSDCLLLQRINLNFCILSELPYIFGQLSFLNSLKLARNNSETLPTSIMSLSKLSFLNIKFCDRLQYLPKLPCQLQNLEAEGCELLKTLSGFISPYYRYLLSFTSCLSVDWKEIRNIIDDAFLNNYSNKVIRHEAAKGRVGLPEGYIGFPGSEIPGFFDIQSSGSRIVLPQGLLKHEFLGFVFCAIVGVKGDTRYHGNGWNYFQYHLSCKYKRAGGIAFFDFICSLFIKKCGIHLLFGEEFERHSKRLETSNFFKGEPSSRIIASLLPVIKERELMEKLTGLSHLFVTVFLSGFASFMVIPAITDVTMLALCPGRDECSLAIYLTGFQQAFLRFSVMVTNTTHLQNSNIKSSINGDMDPLVINSDGSSIFCKG